MMMTGICGVHTSMGQLFCPRAVRASHNARNLNNWQCAICTVVVDMPVNLFVLADPLMTSAPVMARDNW